MQSIAVRETHISWVILTGEYAYKIKKPVRLEFLDFSTLARRQHFCEEELRLNRRFAPDLYLDVVPIGGSLDAPRVGDAGRDGPIEFAVRMKQFPDRERLSRLLANSTVPAATLHRFGVDLGDLQADSKPCATQSEAFATRTLAVVHRNADELLRLSHSTARESSTRLPELDGILQTLHEVGVRMRSALAARADSGFVRECHGDLHAGNVVRIEDRLIAFDCIEFDAALRNIDVVSDVAFLYADLLARKHPSLASGFLDGWLGASGDYAGLELLSFYAAHRALVRAKVDLLTGATDSGEPGAARYLAVARDELAARRPALITMMGLSGSGKSWLSGQLLEMLPAVRVRSDVERRRLAGLGREESSNSAPGEGIYTLDFNRQTYDRMLACARDALTANRSVVVDAAFLRREERAEFRNLAIEAAAPWINVSCLAPLETLAERIASRRARGTDPSEADVSVLERQVRVLEPVDATEREFTIEADTCRPDVVAATMRAVRSLASAA